MSAREVLEGVAGALPVVGSVVSSVASSREARKNREFQERMSSTAHQREVEDLRRAGLNPALSAMRGGGASSPSGAMGQIADFGESAARGISNVLAVKQQRAQIALIEAQARLTETQAQDISATLPGRLNLNTMQGLLAQGQWSQIRALLPELIEKAKAEVKSIEARTALDRYAASGAFNSAEFEKLVGTKGPWARFLFEALKALK